MRERPLSPHLQIYRPQITSVLSILHRITGIALAGGLVLLLVGLLSMAMGFDAYDCFQRFIQSIWGKIMLFGWAWAMSYHLFNGVRHLFWDMGYGFDMETVHASGKGVAVISALFAILVIIYNFI